MERLDKIASLYSALTGDANVTPAELGVYAGLSESVTLEAISASLTSASVLNFAAMPSNDLLNYMFINLFGYTQAEVDALRATEAGAAGFKYWSDELVNNPTMINVNTLAIALLNGAEAAQAAGNGTDATKATALVADIVAAYEDSTDPVTPVDPEGNDLYLTAGVDVITGTSGADTIIADLNQVIYTGAVSNTLATGDRIDGGASTDTLMAQLTVQEVNGLYDIVVDAQPRTKSVEIVKIESQDFTNNGGFAALDAKNMTGITTIGSFYSDGDLVIENLTTLSDTGAIRNTSAMTITMDHTDDMNSDGNASDLTVLFDEDYLVTGQETAGASLTIRLLNALQNEAGNNSVEGFSEISFFVGAKLITVDITSVANDATHDFTTAYDAIVDLINAKLVAEGFASVTASISTLANAVFSIPVAGFDVGDSAGQYYPIVLTNSGSESLTKGNIETYGLNYDTDLNNSFAATAATTSVIPLSVDIELTKVGRDGEGGNLIVGAKGLDSENAGNTDVDLTDGINVFNVTVKGDESKPSNLGVIQSTNDHLTTVNIDSETRADNSYAALTVRGQADGDVFNSDDSRPFGGTLELLDADGFKGDLSIGEVTAAFNIDTFTAMGGGDIYLNELIAANTNGNGSFASLAANEFTIDTAAGADTIIVDANSGAQVDINTGAGADSITVIIDGSDDSGSDETFATIVSGAGNDTVTVSSQNDDLHDAYISTGSENDTIRGNNVNITVDAGSGNDTVYAENTATKAAIEVVAGEVAALLDVQAVNGHKDDNDINETELLYGRTVTVTLATLGLANADEYVQGFESAAISIVASNGYLTTELDLYTAIAKAINDDAVLNKLAQASIDSNGDLTVQYLVDGALVSGTPDLGIEYTISAPSHLVTSTAITGITAALQEKFSDSGITAATVKTAYDSIGVAATTVLTDVTTFDITSDGANSTDDTDNVINGQLGDDVIVLSTSANSNDTLVIDGLFGNDTVAHFTAGNAANEDYLDFTAVLNGQYRAGTSVSEASKNHFDNKLAADATLSFNEVIAFNTNTLTFGTDAATQDTWAELTDSILLAAIKNTASVSFAGITSATLDLDTLAGVQAEVVAETGNLTAATLVGTTVKNIVMIENNLNEGEYKVFELTGTVNATTNEFTAVTLLGTIDFGATQVFTADNIIA